MMTLTLNPTVPVLRRLASLSRTPRLRSMRQFAEEEITLPTGPFRGRKLKVERNPFAALLLDEYDHGGWKRFFSTGPHQSGKSVFVLLSRVPKKYTNRERKV
jgi:hypothetical protein